jgi:hypothetical protein
MELSNYIVKFQKSLQGHFISLVPVVQVPFLIDITKNAQFDETDF